MKNKKNINQKKINELKNIRENLLEYVNQSKDFNLRSLSKSLGRNDAYLQQYIKRGSPSYLPEEERSHFFDDCILIIFLPIFMWACSFP